MDKENNQFLNLFEDVDNIINRMDEFSDNELKIISNLSIQRKLHDLNKMIKYLKERLKN